MPDAPAPTPAPGTPAKTGSPRGYFNKAQLEDLDTAETVLAAARKNAAALAGRDINDAYLSGLETIIKTARRRISDTGQSTDTSQSANLSATGAERALVIALQGIQSAAKQKHKMLAEDDDPATNFPLSGYLIGTRLNRSHALLLQNADALLGKAKADSLPGYVPAEIQKVEAALAACRGTETRSDEADAAQLGDTTARDTLLHKINVRRSALQHAADALWPYTSEDSISFRKAFLLPLSRPLSL